MDRQKEVAKYLIEHGESKKSDIYDAMKFGYFCNASKHFGELLGRMVKNGSIERVSKGVYRINKSFQELINQQKLF